MFGMLVSNLRIIKDVFKLLFIFDMNICNCEIEIDVFNIKCRVLILYS